MPTEDLNKRVQAQAKHITGLGEVRDRKANRDHFKTVTQNKLQEIVQKAITGINRSTSKVSRQSENESSVVYQTYDPKQNEKIRISLQDSKSSRAYGQPDVRKQKLKTDNSVYNSLVIESNHKRSTSSIKKSNS